VIDVVVREIKPAVYFVGAMDWDRRIFDALIPLPNGTSYNSYFISGSEKTALIDTVDASKEEDLIRNLILLKVDRIDYVVVNHAEQDHSGSLPMILELFPGATVVCSEKGKELLTLLLQIPDERMRVVGDGEVISLGDKTLQFFITPYVHWPDTMLTYAQEDKILFSCDFLGSHLASSTLFATEEAAVYESAKRYYAEIMMPFRTQIRTYLERIRGLSLEYIAPSHGPIYRNPAFILDAYADWSSDTVRNLAVIPYVSMHGSVARMVDYLAEALFKRGVPAMPINVVATDIGELAKALVDPATVVVGTPMVLFGPHPAIVSAVYLVGALRPKVRSLSIIGSYGWGGTAVKQLTDMLGRLQADTIEPVFIRGSPTEEEYRALDHLADEIAKRHQEYGILSES
jgi:flavorubredoxin